MQAIELLSTGIQPLRPDDGVARALAQMEEFKVSELPVVKKDRLAGLVKESVLLDGNAPGATVGKMMEQVEVPFVRDRQHVYDVLRIMSRQGLSLIPVLDMTGKYLGVVDEHQALRQLARLMNTDEAGSVVVLEMERNEYALQRIARIVEDDGARILSLYCADLPESSRQEVTLKINREDIRGIVRSFERFEYTVRMAYLGAKVQDDLRDRYLDVMRILKT